MSDEKQSIITGFEAEVVNGHLCIYPQTAEAEATLLEFIKTGVNEQAGAIYLKQKDGVTLDPKRLVFMQVTKKGTPLGDATKEVKGG